MSRRQVTHAVWLGALVNCVLDVRVGRGTLAIASAVEVATQRGGDKTFDAHAWSMLHGQLGEISRLPFRADTARCPAYTCGPGILHCSIECVRLFFLRLRRAPLGGARNSARVSIRTPS